MKETLKGKITNVAITELIKDLKILNISIDKTGRIKEEKFIPIEVQNEEEMEKSEVLCQNFNRYKEMRIDSVIEARPRDMWITGEIQGKGIKYQIEIYQPRFSNFYQIKKLGSI
jgi:hypothetical protein